MRSRYGLPADYLTHFDDHTDRHEGCRYCQGEYISRRQFLAPAANEKINELFDLLGVPANLRDTLSVGDLLSEVIDAQRESDQDRAARRL